MKKIYTLAAFVLIAATSFSQRDVNLALNLTTPVDGSVVAPAAAQQISFTISRTGDQVEVGDTIAVGYLNFTTGMQYSLGGNVNSVSIFVLDATTAPFFNGANPVPSAALNNGAALTLNTTAAGFNLGDTILVYCDIWTNATNPGTDVDFSNNFGEFRLGNTASISNLEKIEFVAFPNPAVSDLTVTASEEVASLKVMNLEGKIVTSTVGNKIDVSYLNAGVYLYEVTTVSGATAVSKFVKQ